MKNRLATITVLFTTLAFLTAVSTAAQTKRSMNIEIPFEFIVGEEVYDAGEYTLERLNPRNPSILMLKNSEGVGKKIFLTRRIESQDGLKEAKIIFSKYDDVYFLTEIWRGGSRNGRKVINGKSEDRYTRLAKAEPERIALNVLP